MTGFEEYGELQGVGFQGQTESIPPEEEFFKSIYIAGITRKNHINIEEIAGKIQIRGLEYNLTEVNMIITHTKPILVREPEKGTRDMFSCFSYKNGPAPWFGTTQLEDGRPRPCPATASERALVDFCAPCRGQILVAGVYCNPDGTPATDSEGKPTFIFLRGKGVKYGNISGYLDEMYKLELSPIFEPVTDQSQEFERVVVNNKRHVTRITMGQTTTRYGDKNVFVLEKGPKLDNQSVMNVLDVTKKTMEKFNEKFDWSKKRKPARPDGVLAMDAPETDHTAPDESNTADPKSTEQPAETSAETPPPSEKTFSFDKIEF
jgi:hypothetical protein